MPAESESQRRYLNARFGHDWVQEHHFDNKGKLPERVKQSDGDGIPSWVRYRPAETAGVNCATCDFFTHHRCEMFNNTYVDPDYVCDDWDGQQDMTKDDSILGALEPKMPPFAHPLIVGKAEAHPAELYLRVRGMSRTPDGQLVYRMVTRDDHYVGRTNPTSHRARLGEVLKVQANDFLQAENGDVQWSNPNVISHYSDHPHSWKEVCALAGMPMEKDEADGPAGDIPPSNDVGNAAEQMSVVADPSFPSGPQLNDVHVDVPLKNISLFYGNKKLRYQVHKADGMKQLVYGTVLEPNSLDSQDDYMLPHHVEKAAHNYLKKALRGRSSVVKLQHREQGFKKNKPSIVPVESFIAPMDFTYDGKEWIKKGSWVMCMHVEDPDLWQRFLDGDFTGFSIGGTGIRRSVNDSQDLTGGDMLEQPADYLDMIAAHRTRDMSRG